MILSEPGAVDQAVKIVITEDEIQVSLDGSLRWRTQISSLILIGEYTTDGGPYSDDYFLDFVSVEEGQAMWGSVTFYAEGSEEALVILGSKLGERLSFELCNSTDWKSRVMWPPAFAGRPYLRAIPYKSLGETLVRSLKFRGHDHVVTDEVKAFIDQHVEKRSAQPPQP